MTDHTPIGDLLRDALPRHQAPSELRRWAEEQARAMDGEPTASEAPAATRAIPTIARRSTWRPLGVAAGLLVAAALGWSGRGLVGRPSVVDRPDAARTAELVDSHVRSLMLDHLVDVRSSDHHTVKPWFLGKAELAPKVPELADAGFPLVGGRMDFVGGRATPVVIYQRRKHFISLYMTRVQDAVDAAPTIVTDRGFNVLSWAEAGIAFRAVSDVALPDLREFQEVYSAAP